MAPYRIISACLLVASLWAGQAMATDMGTARLVPGGASYIAPPQRLDMGQYSNPLLSSGQFSLGTIADAPAAPLSRARGNLAVGGYMAYGLGGDGRLSSSLRSNGSVTSADISAAYTGSLLGTDGVAMVKLGTAWSKPLGFSPNSQGFSPNPLQPGAALSDPFMRAGNDINLSVSLMRQVTPSFSVGGMAEATRSGGADLASPPGFMLGASLGYRF